MLFSDEILILVDLDSKHNFCNSCKVSKESTVALKNSSRVYSLFSNEL